ncbi:sensor histidine kinase [Arhodomonas sp. SL1]|uniref:sensor histidine kinase n=1 Tax=Arhodomonas sp. SL1 TaxID=3425691 RepID=UPI003F884616
MGPRSLRARILTAFALAGLVLGPLVVGVLLLAAYELEEQAVGSILSQRLERIMAEGAAPVTGDGEAAPGLRLFGPVGAEALPEDVDRWRPGLYEIEPDGESVAVEYQGTLGTDPLFSLPRQPSLALAIDRSDGVTYVLAEDLTALEVRESLTIWLVVAAAALAMYLSLWIGYYLSRRLIDPLRRLAAAVGPARAGAGPAVDPADYPDDEVGELAVALADYQRRTYEALERERGFSADVAHELRNPLAVIRSSLELLQEAHRLAGPQRRALERADAATGEMGETLSVLLLLARESPAADDTPVALGPLVGAAVERLRRESDVAIHYSAKAEPLLMAPEAALRSVVENVLANALQSTPEGEVRVLLDSGRLVVADTGIGIPAADLQRIRGRGEQGSNSPRVGSGLGLSIVDRLCRLFGWELEIHSSEGRGTTVTWRFTPASPSLHIP